MVFLNRFKSIATLLIVSLILVACSKETPPRQPPEAGYYVVKTEKLAIENELPGRLESYRNADVRARVPGVLVKRYFEEGSLVKEGQILFQIDPRSYQASVQNAQATLSRAKANKIQIDLKLKRYRPLVKINAISKQEYDEVVALAKQAAAEVSSAQAHLVNAKLDLEYANVRAPISGRIGRAMVTEGALVGQNEPTLLAVIQQIDPMYLNLTQASSELLKLRQKVLDGSLKGAGDDGLEVTMVMEDGTIFPEKGKLLFSDITVDPTTAQLAIRALFPNPKGMILPGMFVRARMQQAVDENAIIIPQQSVQITNDGRATVIVIDNNDKATLRNIKIGPAVKETYWLVYEGLNVGERIVVEGLQKVRPGSVVRPVLWEDPKVKKEQEAAAAAAAATGATNETATAPVTNNEQANQNASQKDNATQQQTTSQPAQSNTPVQQSDKKE